MLRDYEDNLGSRRRTSGAVLHIVAILLIFLALFFCVMDAISIGKVLSAGVLASFFLNALLGIVFLCKSMVSRPFSLVIMHWIFYVAMLVIAPFAQYLNGYSVWAFGLTDTAYIATNIALLLWGMFFALFSSRRDAAVKKAYNQMVFYSSMPSLTCKGAVVAVVVSIAATVLTITNVGFQNLFSRGDFSTGFDQTSSLLFDKAIRPLPVFALAILLAGIKKERKFAGHILIVLICVLLADFPAGMARFNMAMIYGALALLTFRLLFERVGLFPTLFLVLFLVVFPASNSYRHETFSMALFLNAIGDAFINLQDGFCAGDYDAYSMLARSIQYVDNFGCENGMQLLGVLLFFIPRSIWPAKPFGSGYTIAASQGQLFLNVSCPLPAEAMINFGFAGLAGFAMLAGWLCWKVDNWFVKSSSPMKLFYPFACLLFFFMLRGDLLSSFAYSVGYFVSFTVLTIACYGFDAAFRRSFSSTLHVGRTGLADRDA